MRRERILAVCTAILTLLLTFSFVTSQGPGSFQNVRISGGVTPCDGRVEVRGQGGSWSAVCDDGWDYRDASVICHFVGCGMLHEVTQKGLYSSPSSPTTPTSYECNGNEQSLVTCQQTPVRNLSLCGYRNQAGLRCRMPCLQGDPYGLSYRGSITREAYLSGVDVSRRQELNGPVVLGKRRRKRTPLHCPAYRCPYPGPLENGAIQGQYYEYYGVGTILGVRCNVGYRRVGAPWIYCGHSGFWSDTHPLCLPERQSGRRCTDSGEIRNGARDYTTVTGSPLPTAFSYSPSTEVKYSCNVGFFLIGYSRAFCLNNGSWSRPVPFCADHDYSRYPQEVLTAILSATLRVIRGADWRYGNQDGGPGGVGTILLTPSPGFVRVRWDNGQMHDYRMGASGAFDLYLFAGRVPSTTECTDPGIPQFGFRDNDGPFTVGQRIVVSCLPGYVAQPRDTIRCDPGLTWSSPLPTCALRRCGDPGTVSNGQRTPSAMPSGGYPVSSAIVYTCNSGYRLRGQRRLVCLPSLRWSTPVPICSNQCEDPGTPANGGRRGSSFTVGSTVVFSCQPTYQLIGSLQRRCGNDLQWSGTQPQCAALSRCADPGTPSQGSRNPPSSGNTIFSTGDRVLYKCGAGYRLDGPTMRVCQSDRTWSGVQPTCERICCNNPGQPDNARRSGSRFCFNDVVEFSCLASFQLLGAEAITCQSDGSWSHALPQCVTTFSPFCARPCSPIKGSFSGNSFIVGALVQYSCERGYQLDGVTQRRCQENLEWSGSCPQCKVVDCGDPGRPNNGVIQGSAFTYRSVVQYTCNTNYVLAGPSTRQCQEDGSWSEEQPRCIEQAEGECPQPVAPGICVELCTTNNASSCPPSRQCCSNGCGSVCQIPCPDINCRRICPNGFQLDTRGCKLCLCKLPTPCRDPGVISFGSRQTSGFQIGSTVLYECYAGYELIGQNTLTCQPDSTWSFPLPKCQPVKCSPLQLPNGALIPPNPSNTFGTSVRFSCNPGYRLLNGDGVRTCRGDGEWSGRQPRCQANDCGTPESLENGKAQYQSTTVGSQVTWSCNQGYTLVGPRTSVCGGDSTWSPAVPRCQLSNPCNDVRCGQFQECVEYNGRGVCRDTCQEGRCQLNETCILVDVQCVTAPCFPAAQCSPSDPCLLSAEPGPCRASIPRYYYDSTRGECTSFTYGGCLGNTNNFPTKAACQRRCVNDVCQSPQTPGPCASTTTRYYYEPLTQTCLSFVYSGCGGNFNNFKSAEECRKRCRITCIDPGTPSNGRRVVFPANSNFEPRTYITFSCLTGYRLTGMPIISCLDNGTFSSPPPTCQQAACQDPGQVQYATRSLQSLAVGSTVTYTCRPGFLQTGNPTRICQPSREWTGPAPVCSAQGCEDPGTPRNGERMGDSFQVTESVVFRCNPGFRLVGSTERTCQEDGEWSGEQPTCGDLSCSNPGSVENGVVLASPTPHQFSIGTVLSVRCFPGYQVLGNNNVTCLSSGQYSANLPVCALVTCGDPGSPANGRRSGDGFAVGQAVRFSCDEGYVLRGAPFRICNNDGQWSGSQPTCSITRCSPPPRIASGQRIIAPDNGRYDTGTTATYSCQQGYELAGEPVLRCLPNGEYSSPAPSCVGSGCGDPGTPDNALREGEDFSTGSIVRYSCNNGLYLSGGAFRVCQMDGTWSGTAPECTVTTCSDPGRPTNGDRQGSVLSIGATVVYTCNTGYTIRGTVQSRCLPLGVWSSPVPDCIKNSCLDPGVVPYTTRDVSDNQFTVGSVVTYSCLEGYSLVSGSLTLTCQPSGQYDNRVPTCDPASCPNPGQPSNGIRYGDSFRLGSTVAYGCNSGYRLVGDFTQSCQPDRQWSGSQPTCEVAACSDPGAPRNGDREGSLTIGSTLTFTCREGYTLVGDSTSVCQPRQVWSSNVPTCNVVRCGNPGSLANGNSVTLQPGVGGDYTFGFTVQYTCNRGYTLQGPTGATCQSDGEYSQPLPSCQGDSCEDPGTPVNGFRQGSSTFGVGSQVFYACYPGYELVGDIQRQCLAGQSWSTAQPTCQAISCGDPGTPANGFVTGSSYTANSTVYYTCGSGYALEGPNARVCGTDGTWSGVSPSCSTSSCGDPGPITNGNRFGSNFMVGNAVVYSCSTGYNLIGEPGLTCQADGQWSNPVPLCRVVECNDLPAPANGRRNLPSRVYNSVARFTCDQLFVLVGSDSRRCTIDGTWSGSQPTCRPKFCTDPGTVQNADRIVYPDDGQFLVGTRVSFTCTRGYQLVGDEATICLTTGQFSNSLPTCQRATCGDPGTPPNGGRVGDRFDIGDSVAYVCDRGFRLSGPTSRSCLSSGSWTDSLPQCEVVTCDDIGRPTNGQRTVVQSLTTLDFAVNTVVEFTCQPGYTLLGSQSVRCRSDGTYSSSRPTCNVTSCPDPGTPPFSVRSSSQFSTGSAVYYRCYLGYNLIGLPSRQCLGNGRWSGQEPTCRIVNCGDPGPLTFGSRTGDVFTANSSVRFRCSSSYELSGSSERLCSREGQWTGTQPTCQAIVCTAPSRIDFGSFTSTDSTYRVGSVVTYSCSPGYTLIGDSSIQCLETRKYSSSPPRCAITNCPDPGMPANGAREGENFNTGQAVTYSCSAGYKLKGSTIRVCQSDGEWSDTLPSCEVVLCSDPGSISGGRRQFTNPGVNGVLLGVGSVITYSCDARFTLVGDREVTCLESGVYSPSKPRCEVTACQDPGVLANGQRQGNSFNVNDQLVYTCDAGYILVGSQIRVCGAGGDFSGKQPVCEPTRCPDPGMPDNGQRTGRTTAFVFETVLTFTCSSGYELIGSSNRTCQADSTWTGTQPRCDAIRCPGVASIEGGSIEISPNNGLFAAGTVITVTCQRGYRLIGEPILICDETGRYSSTLPRCEASPSCRDPGLPDNGIRDGDSFTVSSIVMYSCRPGYVVVGESQLTCEANGQWSSLPPQCQATSGTGCVDPGTPRNGQRTTEGQFPEIGSVVTFRCLSGYQLSGGSSRTCFGNRQWSNTQPTCVPVQCASFPPVQGGFLIVVPDNGRYTAGTIVTVTCDPGYELRGESLVICGDDGRYSASPPRCVLDTTDAPQVTTAPTVDTSAPLILSAPIWPDPAFSVSQTYVDLNLPASSAPFPEYDLFGVRPGQQSFSYLASFRASSSITVRRVPIVPGQTYQFVIRARVGDIVSDNSLVITITSAESPTTMSFTTEMTTMPVPSSDTSPTADPAAIAWPDPAYSVSSTYVDLNFPAGTEPLPSYDLFVLQPGQSSFTYLSSFQATGSVSVQRVPVSPAQTYQYVFRARRGSTVLGTSAIISVETEPMSSSGPSETTTTSPVTTPDSNVPTTPVWPTPAYTVSSSYIELNFPAASQPYPLYDVFVVRPGATTFSYFASYQATGSVIVQRVPTTPGQTYQFTFRARLGDEISSNSEVITVTSSSSDVSTTSSPSSTTGAPSIPAPVWPRPAYSVSSTYVDLNLPASSNPSSTRYSIFIQREGEDIFNFLASYQATSSVTVRRIPLTPSSSNKFIIRAVVGDVVSEASDIITVITEPMSSSGPSETTTISPVTTPDSNVPTAPVWPTPAYTVSSSYIELNFPAASQPYPLYDVFVVRPGATTFSYLASYQATGSVIVQRVPTTPGQTYQFTFRVRLGDEISSNSEVITVSSSSSDVSTTSSPSSTTGAPSIPAPVWPRPAYSVSSTYVDLNLPASSNPSSTRYSIFIQREGEDIFNFLASYQATSSVTVRRIPLTPSSSNKFIIRAVVGDVVSEASDIITVITEPMSSSGPSETTTISPVTTPDSNVPTAPVWPTPAYTVSSSYIELNFPAASQPYPLYDVFVVRPGATTFSYFASYQATGSVIVQRVPTTSGQTYRFTFRARLGDEISSNSEVITVTSSSSDVSTTSSPSSTTGAPSIPAPVWPRPAYSVSSTYVDLNFPASSNPSSTRYSIFIQREGEDIFNFLASYQATSSVTVRRIPLAPSSSNKFIIRAVVGDVVSEASDVITVITEPMSSSGPSETTTIPPVTTPDSNVPTTLVWPTPAYTVSSSYIELNFPAASQPYPLYDVFVVRPGATTFSYLASYQATGSVIVQRVPTTPGQTYQFTFRARLGDEISSNSEVITVSSSSSDVSTTSSPISTTGAPSIPVPVWPHPAYSVSSTYVDLNLPASSNPSSTRYSIFIQREGEDIFSFLGSYYASSSVTVRRIPLTPSSSNKFIIRAVVGDVVSDASDIITVITDAETTPMPTTSAPTKLPVPVWPSPAFSSSTTYIDLSLPGSPLPNLEYEILIRRPAENSFSFLARYRASLGVTTRRIPVSPGQTYQFIIRSRFNGVTSSNSAPITASSDAKTDIPPTETSTDPVTPAAPVWPSPAYSVSSTYVDLNLPAASQPGTEYDIFMQRSGQQSFSYLASYEGLTSVSVRRILSLQPGATYTFVLRSRVNGVVSSNSNPIIVTTSSGGEITPSVITTDQTPSIPAPVWPKPSYVVTSSYVNLNLPASSQSGVQYDIYIRRPGQLVFVFLLAHSAENSISTRRVTLQSGQTYKFVFRTRYNGATSANSVPITVTAISTASGDHCADPGLPANGLRTGKKPFVVGSVVLYSCYGGYAMQGASSQQCQEDGMWSGARPDCVKGGIVNPTSSSYGVYTQWSQWSCTVTCGSGLQRRQRSCQTSGHGQTCVGPTEETGICHRTPCEGHTGGGGGGSHGTQTLRGCSATSKPLDLMLVVHEPQNPGYFSHMVNFTQGLISHFAVPPVHVGMVRYGSRPVIQFGLSRYPSYQPLQAAVNQLSYMNRGTAVATGSALQSARTLFFEKVGAREGARRVVLLITTAPFNAGSIPGPEADKLRTLGARVVACGVGNVNQKELTDIASHPQLENIVNVASGEQLHTVSQSIAEIICSTP